MKDRIKLYFASHDCIPLLNECSKFIPVHCYQKDEFYLSSQNEYGKFNIENLDLRLYYDYGRNNKCPWCGEEGIKIIHEKITRFNQYSHINEYLFYVECLTCESTGPKKIIYLDDVSKESWERVEALIYELWRCKKPCGS